MKKGAIILFVLICILSCNAGRKENPEVVLEKLVVGETVYVCGCPMMCCNSISRNPKGRCTCNVPLKQGIVSRIKDGKVYVIVSGRGKTFTIPSR
ncbi:MAG: hypothetical protein M0Q01_12800 [Syntrophales bacterium]|jgi:hypothetical protein|nr:hypothetical protein [Syntrophales bacterium]